MSGAGEWPGAGEFVGRDTELRMLTECAARARHGTPWIAVVDGPPGIGKTSLARRFTRGLAGFTVSSASSDPHRADSGYSLLGQLMPATTLSRLNSPVAGAVELLGWLGELQADGPVAVVIDDFQWTDQLSMDALAFAVRRLNADLVLVVLITRDADQAVDRLSLHGQSDRLTRIRLTGLSETEVAEFAAAYLGSPPSRRATRWLCGHTSGHPLHLRALLAESGNGAESVAGNPSLGTTILAWLSRQPPGTRALLEALAVADTRLPLAQLAQLAGVADPIAAMAPALDAELLDWWSDDPSNPVALRHPLHREVLYSVLSPARRSRLHAAAVRFVDRRNGWAHRVAAAMDIDPVLAAELEVAAAQEAEQGEYEIAANYLLWSARLSPDRGEYERRLLTGCLQSLRDYRTDWTARVAAEVDGCAPSSLRSCVQGVLALLRDNELTRAQTLLRDAIDNADRAPESAWVLGTAAAFLASLCLWRGLGRETVDAAELALSVPSSDIRTVDAVRMFRAIGRSRVTGLADAERDLDHLPAAAVDVGRADIESLAGRGAIRAMRGDLAGSLADLTAVLRMQRNGAPCSMGHASFAYLAAVHYLLGTWDDAAMTAYQGLSVVESSGQTFHQCLARLAATLVPAGRGDVENAEYHVGKAHDAARLLGTPQDRRYAAVAGAVLGQARADWPRMLDALSVVRGLPRDGAGGEHSWWQSWWRPLLVEALIGTGRLAEAAHELRLLTTVAESVPYLAPVVARLDGWYRQCRGDHAGARERYATAALNQRTAHEPPLYRAMLEEAFGRSLCAGDVPTAEASRWLKSALRRYQALRATPFIDRCTDCLSRIGHAQRVSATRVMPSLSEREHQIALLAGRGLTNREIAAELYLSGKTIEYHLANVFRKLDITSRRQLRDRVHPIASGD